MTTRRMADVVGLLRGGRGRGGRGERHLHVVRPPADGRGQVAFVAGASRGLGLLVARELAERGCRVAGCSRDADELERAKAQMREWGHDYLTCVADVTDHEAVERAVARVESELGSVDVAIHVAGIIQVGPLESMTREHFERSLDIMLWGPINLALAVLPGMRRRGRGRIGTVTSIGGKVSVPHLLPYSVAKFGAVGFSEGLQAELAGTGITSTTIVPGLMRTGSHLQAQFTGDVGAEYAWFAPGATLPLVALDAEDCAARIAEGVLAGRSHVVLGPIGQVGMRAHGLVPEVTTAAMRVMGRLLPGADGAPVGRTVLGHDAREELARTRPGVSKVVEAVTGLGQRAADRFNETTNRTLR